MEIHELVVAMKLLERRIALFEEKYGILSEDFYRALTCADGRRIASLRRIRRDARRLQPLEGRL